MKREDERMQRMLRAVQVLNALQGPQLQERQLAQSENQSQMQSALAMMGISDRQEERTEDRGFKERELALREQGAAGEESYRQGLVDNNAQQAADLFFTQLLAIPGQQAKPAAKGMAGLSPRIAAYNQMYDTEDAANLEKQAQVMLGSKNPAQFAATVADPGQREKLTQIQAAMQAVPALNQFTRPPMVAGEAPQAVAQPSSSFGMGPEGAMGDIGQAILQQFVPNWGGEKPKPKAKSDSHLNFSVPGPMNRMRFY